MASSMAFDIFARDHASRVFDKVGDNAERLGRRIDGVGKSTSGLSIHVRALDGAAAGLGGTLARAGGQLASMAGSAVALAGKTAVAAGALATLAASAGAATSFTLGLAAALAPVGGLMAALPGVALAGAAAFSVWKLATGGLGEAMGAALSGNVEALSAALGRLSPAGQAFIKEFEQAIPLLKGFKTAAQDAFVGQISGRLQEWAIAARVLKTDLAELAAGFGGLVRSTLDFATTPQTLDQFNAVLRNTRALLDGLWGALNPLLRGFVDLGTVGSSWLASMSGGLQNVLTRFGEWMSRVSASGQAWAWMDNAVAVLKQLGALTVDLWQILSGLLRAAESAGAGALGVLGALVDRFNAWVNSARGQTVLVEIFSALNDVGRALLPVITALAGAIAVIAPEVGKLALAFGPVLAEAIAALGPAIAAVGPGILAMIRGIGDAVSALAPTLLPLGGIIGNAFAALRPLLAAIGPAIAALLPGVELFVARFAAGLAQLAPALAPIGSAIGGIFAALSPLLPVLGQLAAFIATNLAVGVQALLPSLRMLAETFGQALLALAPIVPLLVQLAATLLGSLVPALAPLLPQIAALVTQLVAGLVPALMPLIPIISSLAGVIGQMFVSVLAELVSVAAQILPPLSQAAQIIGLALLDAVQQLAPYIPQLVGAFVSFLPALVDLLPPLAQLAVSLMPRFIDAVVQILPHLPPLIRSMIDFNQALLPLIPVLTDLLKRMAPYIPLFIEFAAVIAERVLPQITRFLIVVTETVGGVIAKFTELYNRLVGHSIIPDLVNGIQRWISGLPGMFSKWFGEAKDWAVREFEDLITWVRGLPGQISGALSGMGNLLGGVGHDLIIGFWNGMVGMFDWLRTSIYNFFSAIMPDWVKQALGIASPSKVFAELGQELPAGMALGIMQASGLVRSAVEGLADMAAVGATAHVGVAPGQAAQVPIGSQAAPTFVFNFSGQPLVSRDEISRLVIAALNEARARGFNLGALGAT